MIAYVNEQIAGAGGKKIETEHLDHDMSVHCVGEYYKPTLNVVTWIPRLVCGSPALLIRWQ